MIKSYLLIAIRNLKRNKAFSFIHITGLSIGLACCMLIFLYAKDEWTFDRFQQRADQLYRITCTVFENDGREHKIGASAMIQGPGFKEAIPAITDYFRVQNENLLTRNGRDTYTEHIVWADDNFFRLFSFPLLSGGKSSVLQDPRSVVITEDIARKYFGSTEPVGKTIEFELADRFERFLITGVAKRAPQNSTIQFDMVLPIKYRELNGRDPNWNWLSFPTYLLIQPGTDMDKLQADMRQVYENNNKEELAEMKSRGVAGFIWGLQPFKEMHLDKTWDATNNVSDPMYSYILSGIAIFILLIACINFINLTVAQSIRRSKEIGIRKVVGGQRRQLMAQFLGESALLCALAFLLAILLAFIALPTFNELSNKQLSLLYLADPSLLAAYIALFLVTAFISGFYPALVLSGFDPVKTLYNRKSLNGKNYLSRILVVVQFSLATFLIIATLFIYAQFNYLTNKKLGYNDNNLIEVSVGRDGDKALMNRFKQRFSAVPGVLGVAPCFNGIWVTNTRANNKDIEIWYEHVDEDFFPVMQVPLISGRNFSPDFPVDSLHSVLINETYAKTAGWSEPIGQEIQFNNDPNRLKVIGVVRDYHFESLRERIRPQMFSSNPGLGYGKFLVRIDGRNPAATISAMEGIFKELVPYHAFQYTFREELNERNYATEQRWKSILSFAAGITIFLSCIGLFGLATLSIRRRVKEIGVRKVLGASVFQVTALVSGNFLLLVLIAFLLAVPAAWYAVNRWLEGFAYQVDFYWWILPLACLSTLLIAFLTVGYQAVRASLSNPVKSLRTE